VLAKEIFLMRLLIGLKNKKGTSNRKGRWDRRNASLEMIWFLPIGIPACITRAPERFLLVSSSILSHRSYCENQNGIEEIPFNTCRVRQARLFLNGAIIPKKALSVNDYWLFHVL
jgi:hypothetical protein